jgi:hypothetical protein
MDRFLPVYKRQIISEQSGVILPHKNADGRPDFNPIGLLARRKTFHPALLSRVLSRRDLIFTDFCLAKQRTIPN